MAQEDQVTEIEILRGELILAWNRAACRSPIGYGQLLLPVDTVNNYAWDHDRYRIYAHRTNSLRPVEMALTIRVRQGLQMIVTALRRRP